MILPMDKFVATYIQTHAASKIYISYKLTTCESRGGSYIRSNVRTRVAIIYIAMRYTRVLIELATAAFLLASFLIFGFSLVRV